MERYDGKEPLAEYQYRQRVKDFWRFLAAVAAVPLAVLFVFMLPPLFDAPPPPYKHHVSDTQKASNRQAVSDLYVRLAAFNDHHQHVSHVQYMAALHREFTKQEITLLRAMSATR